MCVSGERGMQHNCKVLVRILNYLSEFVVVEHCVYMGADLLGAGHKWILNSNWIEIYFLVMLVNRQCST